MFDHLFVVMGPIGTAIALASVLAVLAFGSGSLGPGRPAGSR